MYDDDAPTSTWKAIEQEKQTYALIKDQVFAHTKAFDPDLLEKTGININFANVWCYWMGWFCAYWGRFGASSPSNLFSLCGKKMMVLFSSFSIEYYLTWKILSLHLAFSRRCSVDLKNAVHGFNRHGFWATISGQVVSGRFHPRCNDIQNLTLRLMHK